MTEHIITSSILILAVILVRAMFQTRISKRVCYAVWLLVVIKLMLPLSGIPNHLNVVNILPSGIAGYGSILASDENAYGKNTASDMDDEEYEESKEATALEHEIEPVEQWTGARPPSFVRNEGNFPESISDTTEDTDRILESNYLEYSDRDDGKPFKHTMQILSEKMDIASVFVIIWLIGSGLAACMILMSNFIFRKRLYENRRMAEGISVNQRPPVYITEEVETPCLFGWRHPAIYITKELYKKDKKTLEMILMHETIHYRHMDHIWSLIRCLLLIIYWWNPLVFIAAGLSVVDSELACDEAVIARLGEKNRKEYGESLIAIGTGYKSATGLFVCGAGLSGRKGELKIRMKYLAAKRRKSVSALVLACVLLVSAAGCTFGGAAGQDISSKEEEGEKRKDTGTQEQVYEGGGRMLVQDMEITEGAEEWIAFKRAAIAGKGTEEKPLDITIELQIDGETYTDELSFDGTSFLHDGKKWKYLLDLDGMSGMPEQKGETVVLANEIATYEEVEWSLLSSQSSDWIDCDILFFAHGSVEGDKVCYLGAHENGEGEAELKRRENSSTKDTFEPQEGEINIGYSPVAFGEWRVRYFVPDTDVALEEKLLLALQNFSPKKEAEDGSVKDKHNLGCSVYYDGIEWSCLAETALQRG